MEYPVVSRAAKATRYIDDGPGLCSPGLQTRLTIPLCRFHRPSIEPEYFGAIKMIALSEILVID
jgi:hypothetical protein